MTYLYRHGELDARLLDYVRYPMLSTWNAVKHHFEGERALRGKAEDGFLMSWQETIERLEKLSSTRPHGTTGAQLSSTPQPG